MAEETSDRPTVADLRVGYEREPLAVLPDGPRFSWRVEPTDRGDRQTAYRVLVARTADDDARRHGTLWDSGKAESPNAADVPYDGASLELDCDYYWTVRVWDGEDAPSHWAEPARFSTALGGDCDWDGAWIGYRPNGGGSNGFRSRWSPADEDATGWVQLDLGELVPVDRIDLYPTEPFDGPSTPDGMAVSSVYAEPGPGDESVDGPTGFGFPVRYRVEISNDPDFERSRIVADRTNEDQQNPDSASVVLDADRTPIRYVRITVIDLYEFDPADTPRVAGPDLKPDFVREERRSWQTFALAALAVRDRDGEDRAVDARVAASSSVEDETWGRSKLVDGRYESRTENGSPLLRTELDLAGPVERARAYVCGLGYCERYVNGDRVGDDVLNRDGRSTMSERATVPTTSPNDFAPGKTRSACGSGAGSSDGTPAAGPGSDPHRPSSSWKSNTWMDGPGLSRPAATGTRRPAPCRRTTSTMARFTTLAANGTGGSERALMTPTGTPRAPSNRPEAIWSPSTLRPSA